MDAPRSDAQADGSCGRGAEALRVAVTGAGLMGRWHAHAAQRLGARVVAIVDPDLGRGTALASRHPGARAVADAAAVLRPELIDAVHICAPLPAHVALARLAVEAGVHALVEKPLTATADATRALLDTAQRAGVVVCPVHQMGFQDGVSRARGALGRLGVVARIGFEICSAGGRSPKPTASDCARLDDVVADILPHPLSVLRRLWPGVPLEAARWSVHRSGPGELLVAGEHGGALLSIAVSMHARPTCFEMEVRCREGSLRLDLFHGFCLVRDGRVSRLRKVAQPFADATAGFAVAAANLCRRGLRREPAYPGLRTLVREFHAAVRAGGGPPIPPEDAIEVAVARDAVLARMGAAAPVGRDRAAALQPAVF